MIFLIQYKKYISSITKTRDSFDQKDLCNNINSLTIAILGTNCIFGAIGYAMLYKSYKPVTHYIILSDVPDMFPLHYSMMVDKKTVLKIKELQHHKHNKCVNIFDVQLLNCAKEIMVIHIYQWISKNRLRFIINGVYAKGTIEPNDVIDKPLIRTKVYMKDKLKLDTYFIK